MKHSGTHPNLKKNCPMRAFCNNIALLILLIIIYPTFSLFSADFILSGKVSSTDGSPVEYAKVSILEIRKDYQADLDGNFKFEHLPAGSYTIVVSQYGFKSETKNILIKDKDEVWNPSLNFSLLEDSAIVVSGKSINSQILTSSQSTTVVEGRRLDKMRGQNVMATIQDLPGISVLTTGAGTAKPVIRGLTGPRVLVLTDGIRQEEQQFGEDHTVDLDAFNMQRIEVVRGPQSVLYGSDAFGGVVNVVREKAPLAKDGAPTIGGYVSSNSFSNNKQDAGNLNVYGYNNGIGYRAAVNQRKAGRIQTPNGSLPNTGFWEKNTSASIGTDGSWGNIYLDSFRREAEQDIYNNPVEEPISNGYQRVVHDKSHLHAFLIYAIGNLELDLGYQRNNRREIPGKNIFAPIYAELVDPNIEDFSKIYSIAQVSQNPYKEKQGLNLFLDTTTFDTKFHHKPIGNLKGTLGVSGMNQRNSTIGREPLIPGYGLVNIAVFILEQYSINESMNLTAGYRMDRRGIDFKSNADLGISQNTKNFEAKTGTLGYVWRFKKEMAFAANYGKGFRAPTPFEMFSNGVHEGTGRFEVGSEFLKPEYSDSYDIALRYISNKVKSEISIFQQNIQNFIYSTNAGRIDDDSGLPVFNYRQDKAVLKGGEISLEAEITRCLVLNGGIDFLHGTAYKSLDQRTALSILNGETDATKVLEDLQTNNGSALPRMTPNRGRAGIKLTTSKLIGLENPYLQFSGRFIDRQYRVDKLETRTGSYNLYDISLGWELSSLQKNTDRASFDVIVQNVFNKDYVDHLSRYKDYALNPGINAIFKANIPFTIIE
ncbi:MAG: TonB-dependent receptor [Leptospiraceae bacterium]|nr:TonB-dependent receptor [Leptospiraceae bacterium]